MHKIKFRMGGDDLRLCLGRQARAARRRFSRTRMGLVGGLMSFVPFLGSVLTAILTSHFVLEQWPFYAAPVIVRPRHFLWRH